MKLNKKKKCQHLTQFILEVNLFPEDTQNYVVLQPINRYFRRVAGVGRGNYIYFLKSKGLSNENIAPHATNGYSLTPNSTYFDAKTRAEFNRSCLKQDKIMHSLRTIVNIYIGCEINKNLPISSYPTLENRWRLE